MAITPNFRPAQHVYQSTYQPLPFEEIAGLGMYMQGKADKTREATYAMEDEADLLASTVGGGDVNTVKSLVEGYKASLEQAKQKAPMGSMEYENMFRKVKRDAAANAGTIQAMQKTKVAADAAAIAYNDASTPPWMKEVIGEELRLYSKAGSPAVANLQASIYGKDVTSPENQASFFSTGKKEKELSGYMYDDLKQHRDRIQQSGLTTGLIVEDVAARAGLDKSGTKLVSGIPEWVRASQMEELRGRAIYQLKQDLARNGQDFNRIQEEQPELIENTLNKLTTKIYEQEAVDAVQKVIGEDINASVYAKTVESSKGYDGTTPFINMITEGVDATADPKAVATALGAKEIKGTEYVSKGITHVIGLQDYKVNLEWATKRDVAAKGTGEDIISRANAITDAVEGIGSLSATNESLGNDFYNAISPSFRIDNAPKDGSVTSAELEDDAVYRNKLLGSLNTVKASIEKASRELLGESIKIDTEDLEYLIYENEPTKQTSAFKAVEDQIIDAYTKIDAAKAEREKELEKDLESLSKDLNLPTTLTVDMLSEVMKGLKTSAKSFSNSRDMIYASIPQNRNNIVFIEEEGVTSPSFAINGHFSKEKLASLLDNYYEEHGDKSKPWLNIFRYGSIKGFKRLGFDVDEYKSADADKSEIQFSLDLLLQPTKELSESAIVQADDIEEGVTTKENTAQRKAEKKKVLAGAKYNSMSTYSK